LKTVAHVKTLHIALKTLLVTPEYFERIKVVEARENLQQFTILKWFLRAFPGQVASFAALNIKVKSKYLQ